MFRQKKDELSQLLQPLKKRLSYQRLVKCFSSCFFYGLGFSVVLLLFSRWLPIYYSAEVSLALLGLAFVVTLVWAYRTRASEEQAAAYADSQGLEEKISTSWQFRDEESSLVVEQRADALHSLRKKLPEIRASISLWSLTKQGTVLLSCLALLWLALFLYPNPLDDVSKMKLAEQKAATTVEKKLEEEIKKTVKNEQLAEQQKEQLAVLLEEIKKKIKEGEETEVKLRALEDARQELAQLQEDEQKKEKALQHLQQRLAEKNTLEEVAQALSSLDRQTLLEAMQKLSELIATFSEEEQAELAQFLEELAQETESLGAKLTDEQLATIAEQLKQAAAHLRQDDLPATFEELRQALTQAQEQMAQREQLNQHLGQALAALEQGQMNLAQASSSGGGLATSVGQGSNSQPSNSGSSTGSGTGSGTGTEQGSGSGSGSVGIGSGSSSVGSGVGQGNGAGQDAGIGVGQGFRELVTVPRERMAEAGAVSETVGGPLGEGASETSWSNSSQVSAGLVRPYAEVYQEYSQMARESLKRNEIPRDYEELVKQYFSELEPY